MDTQEPTCEVIDNSFNEANLKGCAFYQEKTLRPCICQRKSNLMPGTLPSLNGW